MKCFRGRRLGVVSVFFVAAISSAGGPAEVVSGLAVASEGAPRPAAQADSCGVLQGLFGERFDVEPSAVTFRDATRAGNDLCRAIWDIPGIDDAERTRRALDKNLRHNNEVSLTIMGTEFDSPEAAVADLESSVATLSEGIEIEVAGRKRTRKVEFGDWVDGVGDKAILNGSSILVAAKGVRFTAAVSTTDDEGENQALAIELAKRIVDAL